MLCWLLGQSAYPGWLAFFLMATAEELAQRSADILAIEDDTMTWDGADYSCTAGELTKTDAPEVGGFAKSYDMSVYVRTGLFSSTRPNVDDTVTVRSKTFKVVTVHEHPDDLVIELELRSENVS